MIQLSFSAPRLIPGWVRQLSPAPGTSPTRQSISEAAKFLQLANGKQSSSSLLEIQGGHRGKELSSPHSLGWGNWDELVTAAS